jgi:hypothetical protein
MMMRPYASPALFAWAMGWKRTKAQDPLVVVGYPGGGWRLDIRRQVGPFNVEDVALMFGCWRSDVEKKPRPRFRRDNPLRPRRRR